MRLIAILCALVLSTTVSVADSFTYSNNPAITFHFGDKVSQSSRDNIIEGVRRVEEYFLKQTGDKFVGNINVVAYHEERFYRKTVPSKYRYNQPCGGGFTSNARGGDKHYVVICLSSWPFENAAAKSVEKLAEQERNLAIHEMTHVMQKQWMGQKPHSRNPHWIRESDANYVGQLLRSNGYSRVQALARIARNSNPDISLRKIHTMDDFADHRPFSYSNTAQATHWLIEQYGWEAIKDYWQSEGAGKAPNAAFRSAYGMSLNEFYKQFEYMPQE